MMTATPPPPPPPVAEKPTSGGDGVVDDNTPTKPTTPRLPRWTRHEILVLIEGKRVVESQARRGRTTGVGGSNSVEPKWVSISSYCKRLGVNREPVQCRKRWGNLAGDFRKIKEQGDSFWTMRNDLRRDKKLPGFFDREIYDVLQGAVTFTATPMPMGTHLLPLKLEKEADLEEEPEEEPEEEEPEEEEPEEEEAEAVFDSGRTAAPEDGLFSDFEQQHTKQDHDHQMVDTPIASTTTIPSPMPISERRYRPLCQAFFDQGRMNVKQPASNSEKGSPSREGGQKRRRMSSDDGEDTSLQEQLVKILESNNKMLAAQLEAQNANCHLDRDQRKDQGDSLVAVLNKLVDALGKIADKI